MIKIIIAFGSVDEPKVDTPFNIPFRIIEEIRKRYNLPDWERKHNGDFTRGDILGREIMLFRPMEKDANFGFCIKNLINFYKVKPSEIVIIYSDPKVEHPIGDVYYIRNGLKSYYESFYSLDSMIGGDWWRIKLGVKPEDDPDDLFRYFHDVMFNCEMEYYLEKFESSIFEQMNEIINTEWENLCVEYDPTKTFWYNKKRYKYIRMGLIKATEEKSREQLLQERRGENDSTAWK